MEVTQPAGLSQEDFLQIQNHSELLEKLKEKDPPPDRVKLGIGGYPDDRGKAQGKEH